MTPTKRLQRDFWLALRKRFTAEQIIMKLREAKAALAQGKTVVQVCKLMGVTGQTYYR